MNAANRAAAEILAFYVEAGVTDLVDETPHDHLAHAAQEMEHAGEQPDAHEDTAPREDDVSAPDAPSGPLRETANPASATRPALAGRMAAPAPARAAAPVAPDVAAMAAREAARSAATLEDLRAMLAAFEGCALRLTAKQMVFADGNPQARLMVVGEAPGREEDIAGLPFVGRSGQLLDLMLKAIGYDRTSTYVTNIIPWRPPGNRDPSPQESTICLPFIKRQIELVNPDVLVCLGKPSMATLLGITEGIRKARGRWVAYDTGTRQIRAMATFHPAYLLRSPLEKRHAWRDLLTIKAALAEVG